MNRALMDQLARDRRNGKPVVLATLLRNGEQRLLYLFGKEGLSGLDPRLGEAARAAIWNDKSQLVETADGPVFLNVFNPPLRLYLIGAVHIGQALVPMAQLAGYNVTVIDPRGAFATAERFPGISLSQDWPDDALTQAKLDHRCAVIALTHDPKLDDPGLTAALKSDAFYIGALGSKKTHATRLERLAAMGFQPHDLARIHGPLGLSIGAVSPAEIAVSALAQMTQTLRQSGPKA